MNSIPFVITDLSYSEYKSESVNKLHSTAVLDILGGDESPAKWQPMLDMRVDRLQADHPDELIAYLKK